jgi:hypothetical protein
MIMSIALGNLDDIDGNKNEAVEPSSYHWQQEICAISCFKSSFTVQNSLCCIRCLYHIYGAIMPLCRFPDPNNANHLKHYMSVHLYSSKCVRDPTPYEILAGDDIFLYYIGNWKPAMMLVDEMNLEQGWLCPFN